MPHSDTEHHSDWEQGSNINDQPSRGRGRRPTRAAGRPPARVEPLRNESTQPDQRDLQAIVRAVIAQLGERDFAPDRDPELNRLHTTGEIERHPTSASTSSSVSGMYDGASDRTMSRVTKFNGVRGKGETEEAYVDRFESWRAHINFYLLDLQDAKVTRTDVLVRRVMGTLDSDALKFALRQNASHVKNGTTITVEALLQSLEDRYQSSLSRYELLGQLMQLKQGEGRVETYVQQFESLHQVIDSKGMMDKDVTLATFLGGLKPEIAKVVASDVRHTHRATFERFTDAEAGAVACELSRLALSAERELSLTVSGSRSRNRWGNSHGNHNRPTGEPMEGRGTGTGVRPGVPASKNAPGADQRREGLCDKCGTRGHWARNCPLGRPQTGGPGARANAVSGVTDIHPDNPEDRSEGNGESQ